MKKLLVVLIATIMFSSSVNADPYDTYAIEDDAICHPGEEKQCEDSCREVLFREKQRFGSCAAGSSTFLFCERHSREYQKALTVFRSCKGRDSKDATKWRVIK